MSTLIARQPLHCNKGTSDKVYIVELWHTGPARFEVQCRYGPRDKELLQVSPQGAFTTIYAAYAAYAKASNGKLNKDYRVASASIRNSTAYLDTQDVKTLQPSLADLILREQAGEFNTNGSAQEAASNSSSQAKEKTAKTQVAEQPEPSRRIFV